MSVAADASRVRTREESREHRARPRRAQYEHSGPTMGRRSRVRREASGAHIDKDIQSQETILTLVGGWAIE